jgi:hypothetical protein
LNVSPGARMACCSREWVSDGCDMRSSNRHHWQSAREYHLQSLLHVQGHGCAYEDPAARVT